VRMVWNKENTLRRQNAEILNMTESFRVGRVAQSV
jgi:hypothetical protein